VDMDRVLLYIYRAPLQICIGLFCGDIMEARHLEDVSHKLQHTASHCNALMHSHMYWLKCVVILRLWVASGEGVDHYIYIYIFVLITMYKSMCCGLCIYVHVCSHRSYV